jgi:CspA family cold shock protein
MTGKTAKGTVKFYNAVKQFGFINGDDGKSYYFHATQIEKGVKVSDGDKVSFIVSQGERGPRAENVRKAGDEEQEAGESDTESGSDEASSGDSDDDSDDSEGDDVSEED